VGALLAGIAAQQLDVIARLLVDPNFAVVPVDAVGVARMAHVLQ
jgi:hypothetical protein